LALFDRQSSFTETGHGNCSSIFALSHFRTENRCPPTAREDGRKRPDASAGAGIFLKMLWAAYGDLSSDIKSEAIS
jgi:hypothetical protein